MFLSAATGPRHAEHRRLHKVARIGSARAAGLGSTGPEVTPQRRDGSPQPGRSPQQIGPSIATMSSPQSRRSRADHPESSLEDPGRHPSHPGSVRSVISEDRRGRSSRPISPEDRPQHQPGRDERSRDAGPPPLSNAARRDRVAADVLCDASGIDRARGRSPPRQPVRRAGATCLCPQRSSRRPTQAATLRAAAPAAQALRSVPRPSLRPSRYGANGRVQGLAAA